MVGKYSLWLYQLIIPICDPVKPGIEGYPRNNFYKKVDILTNVYEIECDIYRSYSHKFEFVFALELVRWDSVLIWGVYLGGSDIALHTRWIDGSTYYKTT